VLRGARVGITKTQVQNLFETLLVGTQRAFLKDIEQLQSNYRLVKHVDTAYGVLLAIAQFISHTVPTKSKNVDKIFDAVIFKQHPLMRKGLALVKQL